MDFSDLQVLSAKNSIELDHRIRVLALVRSYTLAFFDKYLWGMKAPLLDRSTPDEVLESVQKFSPAKRQN
jgi:hypothetical protein